MTVDRIPLPDLSTPRPIALPSYQDVMPTFRGPRYLNEAGQATDIKPDTSILQNIQDRYVVDGYGLSGRLGVFDLPSPQGFIAEASGDSMLLQAPDYEYEKRMNPKFFPLIGSELDEKSGSQYYEASVPKLQKDILQEAGYGPDRYARFATAREAKDFHGQILRTVKAQQSMAAFDQTRGVTASVAGWVGNFGLSVAADPTNLLALGAPSLVKGVATKAVGVGTAELLGKALSTRTAQALSTGLLNEAQYSLQAVAADAHMEEVLKFRQGEYESNYSVEGATTSAMFGIGLSAVLGYALGRSASSKTAKDIDASIPVVPSHNTVKVDFTDTVAVKAAEVQVRQLTSLGEAMKRLVNNETFLQERWTPELMKARDAVAPGGDSSKSLMEFMDKNPTVEELNGWFDRADAMVADKVIESASGVSAPRRVPSAIEAATPTWGPKVRHQITFESPVDKALYMITRSIKDRTQLLDTWTFLRTATGMTDDQIQMAAIAMDQEVSQWGRVYGHETSGQIHIVNTFDKPDMIVSAVDGKFTKPVPGLAPHPLSMSTAAEKAGQTIPGLMKQLQDLENLPNVSDKQIQRQIKKLRRKIGPLAGDIKAAKQDLTGKAGSDLVTPVATQGQLADDLAYKELDRTLLDEVKEDLGLTPNSNFVFRGAQKVGRKILSTGLDEVLWNNSPVVRYLGSMVAEGGLMGRAYGSAKAHALNFQARLHESKALAGQYRTRLRSVYKKHNLTAAERELVNKKAWTSAGGAPIGSLGTGRLDSAELQVRKVYSDYLQSVGQEGVRSRYFPSLDEDYVNTLIKQTRRHEVNEIGRRFYEYWKSHWKEPAAELHIGTLKNIGLITQDGKSIREGFGYDDILDGKGIRFFTDLTPEHRAQYLADLDSSTGALASEAFAAAERKTGNFVTSEPDGPIRGVRTDPKKTRQMKKEIYFSGAMDDFMETNLEVLIDHYAETTAYRVGRHKSVSQLTGRTDITWKQLLEWGKSRAMKDLPDAADRKAISDAFDIIENKEQFLDRSLATPSTNSLKFQEFAANSLIDLARVGVSARNSMQQVISEWPTILLRGGGLSPTAFKDMVSHTLTAHSDDALHGMYYLAEDTKTNFSRMMYDMDPEIGYSFSWADKAIRNPLTKIKEARGAYNTINAVTNWMAEFSKATSLEDASNVRTRTMAAGAERAKFGRHWKAVTKMSKALEDRKVSLQSMTPAERRSTFIDLARKSGFGGDHYYAARLNQAGLLSPQFVASIEAMNTKAGGKLISSNGRTLLYKDLSSLVAKERDRALQTQLSDSTGLFMRFLETQVDTQVIRPGPWDIRTEGGSRSVYGKMDNAFLSWGRSWYNKRMVDAIGNARTHHALGLLGMAVLSEVMYGVLNKYLTQGYSKEDLIAEWEENPSLQLGLYASRMNVLGGAQALAFQLADATVDLDGRPAGQGAPYPVVAATNAFISGAKGVKAAFDEDAEMTPRDVDKLNRIMPVLSNPLLQLIAKQSGYKSLGEMFTEGFD